MAEETTPSPLPTPTPPVKHDPLLVLGGYSGMAWGAIFLLVGLAWLGKEMGFYLVGMSFWPVFFIVVGLALIAHYFKR